MIRVDETDPVGEIEPSFPYRDVTVRRGSGEFKKNYDIQSEIGRGKFGTVYRCKDKETGLSLAAKVVNTMKKEDRRSVEREVEIMRRLQHPRLIQLYDAIDTGKQIYVILELIEGGELFERVIDDDFVLTERSCAVFLRQICEGIDFIHAQKILHLDLKPENILCLTKEGNRIKIIDFGLAREYDPNKKLQVLFGTPEFVAPEVVNFDQIGFGTDMWSIGVICYVLLSGLSPFMGDTDIETMANVTVAKYDFDHEAFNDISEDAKDFIRCLLVKDKEKRMNAAQCREHRWLARKTPTTSANGSTTVCGPEARLRKDGEGRGRTSISIARVLAEEAGAEELDVTKDNLRLFVERWREHPDSPYMIDAPVFRKMIPCEEVVSLRCHSPSPCESICSSVSETATNVSSVESRGTFLSVPSLNLALERRASEGTTAEKSRDPASQIVLADEIIRLSEHLRSIAMTPRISSPAVGDDARVQEAGSRRPSKSKVHRAGILHGSNGQSSGGELEHNEIAQKLSSIARRRKLNGTTFHSSRSFDRQTESSATVFGSFRRSSRVEESVTSVRRDSQGSAVSVEESGANRELRFPMTLNDTEMDLTPPWRRPRVKHSFGETSRDVPRISTLRDLHKNLNLDEPGCAKDLLLHLLGEWEESPRSTGIGRNSVSVDWCGEDSVARKTINSLAEYFQSKQQSLNSSSVPPTSPSIHR